MGYLKGGSISWDGFYCIATAGQMIVGATPVTFALTLNWTDREGSEDKVVAAYKTAVTELLRRLHRGVRAQG